MKSNSYNIKVTSKDKENNIGENILQVSYCTGKIIESVKCSTCAGTGTVTTSKTCSSCNGSGRKYYSSQCQRCYGGGKDPTTGGKCTSCNRIWFS